MATIKDVAKLAGVSPSTVSRVIAGSDRISDRTKERVRQAMKEVNYVPNAIARSLVQSRTRTVGFTLSRRADQAFSNPFFSEVLRGMSKVAQRWEHDILLSISLNEQDEKEKCLQLIRERRVDGLIISTSRIRDEVIEVLLREKTPFVVIGRSAGAPVLSVNNDNVEASRRATNHLLEQGYRKIAFISGPRNLVVSLDRCHGYEKALAEAGLPVESERIVETDFSEDAGFAALYRMREAGVEFDAVLASDDLFALGALRFANHTGLRVPEELGIVGFNDTPMMSHTHPPLTSVRILSYELGAEAMELLLQGLKNPEKLRPGKEILLPAELRVRRSSLRRQGRDGSKKVGKGEKEMSKEKLLRRFREMGEYVRSLEDMPEMFWWKPIAEGKWSPAEIVAHLVFWDRYLLDERLEQLQPGETVPASGEVENLNERASKWARSEASREEIISVFCEERAALVSRLETIPEPRWEVPFTIGARSLTLTEYIGGLADHDDHHRAQIEVLRSRM